MVSYYCLYSRLTIHQMFDLDIDSDFIFQCILDDYSALYKFVVFLSNKIMFKVQVHSARGFLTKVRHDSRASPSTISAAILCR